MDAEPKLLTDPNFKAALKAFETDSVEVLDYAASCILSGAKLTNNSLRHLNDQHNAQITAFALGFELANIYPHPLPTHGPRNPSQEN
jgi:hypothetical protein